MGKLILQLIWLGISYIIGSIPFGLIIAKFKEGIDLREVGSGNIGATNVARTCGFFYGICTFLLDMLKGIIALSIAFKLSTGSVFISLVAISVIVGHMYSFFLDYNGGKGVATTIGVYLMLNTCGLIISLILAILVISLTGYVSLGSIVLVMIMPIFLLFQKGFIYFILSLIIMVLVINKHSDNIIRVLKGEENTWKKQN